MFVEDINNQLNFGNDPFLYLLFRSFKQSGKLPVDINLYLSNEKWEYHGTVKVKNSRTL